MLRELKVMFLVFPNVCLIAKCLFFQEDLVVRQKARAHISSLLEEMSHTVHKLRLLDHQWPSIIQEIVCNTLLDYSHMDLYMKQKLQELMNA